MENKDENTIVKLNERDGLYGIGEVWLSYLQCSTTLVWYFCDMMLGKDVAIRR